MSEGPVAQFINSSALTKLLANVFVFLVLTMALAIAGYDTLTNAAISPYISTLIGGGLTYAVGILGVHLGASGALQAQQQVTQTPPTAMVPLAVQVQSAAPVDPEATAQRPVVLPPASPVK